jgi:leucyl-tRNA synthetase
VETNAVESSDPATVPGAERTWIQGTKNKSVYLSAVKAFCAAALGLDLKNADHQRVFTTKVEPLCEAIMLKAITENAFKDRLVNVDVTKKEKRTKAGEFYNLHIFSPAEPPTPELFAKLGISLN